MASRAFHSASLSVAIRSALRTPAWNALTAPPARPSARPSVLHRSADSKPGTEQHQIKADTVGAEALARQGLEPLPFSPHRLATRALMYGTALSVGCFSAGVLVVGYSMGVTSVSEVLFAWLGWRRAFVQSFSRSPTCSFFSGVHHNYFILKLNQTGLSLTHSSLQQYRYVKLRPLFCSSVQ